MRRIDAISRLVRSIVEMAGRPLETSEVFELVKKEAAKVGKTVSRTIVLKRLHILRGDKDINGRFLGSGKGVWIWWKKDSFHTTSKQVLSSEKLAKVVSVVDSSGIPLETKDIETRLPELSRVQIMHRISLALRDGIIEGKQVGSGKKVWILWGSDAFA